MATAASVPAGTGRGVRRLRTALAVVLAAGWLAVLSPGAAAGDVVVPSEEFPVNTYTLGNQERPQVAATADGGFVVVWASWLDDGSDGSTSQDGSFAGVFGQRYGADGAPVGGEFRVNTYADGWQVQPAVAGTADGGFVVVWGSDGDGSVSGVFGQRYGADGAPIGGEFPINTYTLGMQYEPKVAGIDGGGFVVVWTSSYQDGSEEGVFGQRYGADGARVGGEFPVNSDTLGYQYQQVVTGTAGGGFVVVWNRKAPDGDRVFGQRYGADGAPAGGEFPAQADGFQFSPALAATADGGFVVVWMSSEPDSVFAGVAGQRFGVDGTPTGDPFPVSTDPGTDHLAPAVASTPGGGFVVVWTSPREADAWEVFGRRYGADGTRIGREFPVNGYTAGNQWWPTVASHHDDGFVVLWESEWQDGSQDGVFGRRFGLQPDADADGDGILDGEDNCPDAPNPAQADADGDGTGDVCEAGPITVSISHTITLEGDTAATPVDVTIALDRTAGEAVTVDWATVDGLEHPTAEVDYAAASGTVTFEPGETSKTIAVTVIGDTLDEPGQLWGTEWGGVVLSNPTGAELSTQGLGALGLFLIVDDD